MGIRLMKSKFDLIAELKGRRVLDIGGSGYNETGRRSILLEKAWNGVERTVLDVDPRADLVVNLDERPLPALTGSYDVAIAFDVLEHLKNPGEVLEWIPVKELWVNLPCATSLNCQRIERACHKQIADFRHLYSFNMLTAKNLSEVCGWRVTESFYTLDTQSVFGRIFNAAASLAPYFFAMGVMLKLEKK